jgi:GNAT superfamily N-acetyltransferase
LNIDRIETMKAFSFYPLTSERWSDFERLFGRQGAYSGCWCMWWRITRREFDANGGEGNRLLMKSLVDEGEVPGILAFEGDRPVGWCSIAPRTAYGALERSPVLKRVDDQPVWSLVCFYIERYYRQRGLSGELIEAAVNHAAKHGAKIVEAYPVQAQGHELPPVTVFMGLSELFEKHGFQVVAKPSMSRLIMRRWIDLSP